LPLVMVERHSWNSVFPIPRSVDMGLQEIIWTYLTMAWRI
jgi:hypothetical protein